MTDCTYISRNPQKSEAAGCVTRAAHAAGAAEAAGAANAAHAAGAAHAAKLVVDVTSAAHAT